MILTNMMEQTAAATEASAGGGGALAGGLVALLVYVVYAASYASIAKKTGHRDIAWWAWVPLLNLWLAFKIAGMGIGWFLMTLLPVVNVFAWIRLCLGTAKVRNKSALTGIFAAIFPMIGFPLLAAGD